LTWKAVLGEAQLYVLEGKKRVPVGAPLPDYYPAIVSGTNFYAVQKMMSDALTRSPGRASNDETNLFTGMVYHAEDSAASKERTAMVLHRPQGSEQNYVYLKSGAYMRGRKGAGTSFPYWPFERAVLDAVCELRPSEVSDRRRGPGGSLEDEIQKVSREMMATDQKLAVANKEAVEADDIKPYLTVIKALNAKKDEQTARLEALKAQAAVNTSAALEEAQSMVALMATKKGEERDQLRRRVKARLQSLVSEIWVLIEKRGARRVAQCQMFLKSGKVRELAIHHPPIKAGDEPFLLTDLTGVDLRNYAAEVAAGRSST
jgi:hypothetical protein